MPKDAWRSANNAIYARQVQAYGGGHIPKVGASGVRVTGGRRSHETPKEDHRPKLPGRTKLVWQVRNTFNEVVEVLDYLESETAQAKAAELSAIYGLSYFVAKGRVAV